MALNLWMQINTPRFFLKGIKLMALIKCKMCGGQLNIEPDSSVCECEYCGSKQTIPNTDDEKRLKLYERANRLRFDCEFDKAAGVYEAIVADYQEEAEAYWGLVLCKYGIEYVDDPATGKKIPTCHRSSFESVMDDQNFEMVMENADVVARGIYREEAKRIEEIRKGIIEVSSTEEPYDIFICYKETADNGDRTIDSVIAQDVYNELTEKGYRVFFSRITLEDKLGQEYEPYIFAALNSAKVMLAFGTSYDYYNAVWVKNEWSRFLKMIAEGQKKTLIPCYKDIDAYDMPKEFKHLQAQDMGKVGAVQDLVRGIGKIIKTEAHGNKNVSQMSGSIDALLERGFMALEDEDFEKADGLFEDVLNNNPKCASAYMGKIIAHYRMKNAESFAELIFKKFFKDFSVEVTETPNYDVAEIINDYFIVAYTIPEYKALLRDMKISYKTCNEQLGCWAEEIDYVEAFCERYDNNKLYSRFKQYASDEEQETLDINLLIAELVKAEIEKEEDSLTNLRDENPWIYDSDVLIDAINAANATIDDKLIEKYGKNYRELYEEFQRNYSEYEEKVKYINEKYKEKCELIKSDWIRECSQKEKEWEDECNRLRHENAESNDRIILYNDEVDAHNKNVEEEYNDKVENFNRESRIIGDEIKNLLRKKETLSSVFKRKERKEVDKRLESLYRSMNSLHYPVMGEFKKKLNLEPLVLRNKPVFQAEPNYPKKQELPSEPEMTFLNHKECLKILFDELRRIGINPNKATEIAISLGDLDENGFLILGNYEGTDLAWKVLKVEGDRALVISQKIIDCMPYSKSDEDVTWRDSNLRHFLNKAFFVRAFSKEIRKQIVGVINRNLSNEEYQVISENDTFDKIFCLSIDEVDEYLKDSGDRTAKTSEKVKQKYKDNYYIMPQTGVISWWLRSHGDPKGVLPMALGVDGVSVKSYFVTSGFVGIRPAMWLELNHEE